MNRTSSATCCRHESKDNSWSLDWAHHWTEQALLHACSKHEWNKLCYMHVVNMNRTSFIKCNRHESEVSLLQWHLTRRNRLETFDEMSLKHFMSRRELETLYIKKRAWNTLYQEEIDLKRLMKWAWNAQWNELETLK